jgi:hypothetical protein
MALTDITASGVNDPVTVGPVPKAPGSTPSPTVPVSSAVAKERPVRAGIYSTVERADRAVHDLLQSGFNTNEIIVVCSDRGIEKHFSYVKHEQPAGSHTPVAATAGAAIGATIGGIAVGVVGSIAGLGALLAAETVALGAGTVVGGLIGAMMTRGLEDEVANLYDQELSAGKILVAVDVKGDDAQTRLAKAEKILADAGADPLPLPEG